MMAGTVNPRGRWLEPLRRAIAACEEIQDSAGADVALAEAALAGHLRLQCLERLIKATTTEHGVMAVDVGAGEVVADAAPPMTEKRARFRRWSRGMKRVEVFNKHGRFKGSPDRAVTQRGCLRLHERPHQTARRLAARGDGLQTAKDIAWTRLQLHAVGTPRHGHWLAVVRYLQKMR